MTKKGWLTILAIVLIAGAVYGLNYAKKTGVLDKVADKVAPAGKQTADLSADAKKAVKEGMAVIKVGINTWGGYAPGFYYNGGLAGNTSSRYYQDGIIVQFVKIEDVKPMRDAFNAGAIDIMGLATVDSLPVDGESLMEAKYKPRVFMKTDDSRGGDAVVAVAGIKTARDAIGKKIAVAIGSPSHTLLLVWLTAGGVNYNEVIIVGTDSGLASAQQFKAGAVDIAVVWSPDDEDCVKAVPGASIIFNTKKADRAISDVFLVNENFLKNNREAVRKFANGWFIAAAEINTSSSKKSEAARILNESLNLNDVNLAMLMIDNARLSTYGDNLQFFGLKPAQGAVTGEEMYNKMLRLYSSVNELHINPAKVPMWRDLSETSVLSSLNLSGSGHAAENAPKFSAPTQADTTAPSFASRPAPVQYEFGSARLTDDGKISIDRYFSNTVKEFASTRVRIEGNTDNVGGSDSNVKLSYSRAKSVADYLIAKYGFDRKKFVIVGHGYENPVSGCEANATEDCRAKNRRTELYLLN